MMASNALPPDAFNIDAEQDDAAPSEPDPNDISALPVDFVPILVPPLGIDTVLPPLNPDAVGMSYGVGVGMERRLPMDLNGDDKYILDDGISSPFTLPVNRAVSHMLP